MELISNSGSRNTNNGAIQSNHKDSGVDSQKNRNYDTSRRIERLLWILQTAGLDICFSWQIITGCSCINWLFVSHGERTYEMRKGMRVESANREVEMEKQSDLS